MGSSTAVSSTLIPITQIEYDKANENVDVLKYYFLKSKVEDDVALETLLRLLKDNAEEQLGTFDIVTRVLTQEEIHAARNVTNEILYMQESVARLNSKCSPLKSIGSIFVFMFVVYIVLMYFAVSQRMLLFTINHEDKFAKLFWATTKNAITLGLYGYYKAIQNAYDK